MVGGTMTLPALSADARVVAVREVHIHPGYSAPQNENDITVLILDAPALVPPARFATDDEITAANEMEVVGFGYNDPNRPLGLGTKRRAAVPGPVIMAKGPNDDLGNLPATLGFHPEYELVAGRKFLGIDSCNGDSGGPIYVSAGGAFKLAGLTSRATRTALANCGDGGIYVRPAKFRAWIDQVAADAGVAQLPA
jgi:endonuclease G